jgi:ABC-2 type transport system ATP-binding protein
LDEPTSGLDPEAAQQVDDLIVDLGRTDGQTVILATHNLLEAQRLCDRVAIISQGKILALGSLNELARKLWPVTWVDVVFHVKPSEHTAENLKAQAGVIQATTKSNALSVQVESEAVIPAVVRNLVEQGESVLRVNPRAYTLEDIYFALQAGVA